MQEPTLPLGLERATRRKKLQKIIEIIDEVEDRGEGCRDVGGAHDLLPEKLEVEAQRDKDATPCQLKSEKLPETKTNGMGGNEVQNSQVRVLGVRIRMRKERIRNIEKFQPMW